MILAQKKTPQTLEQRLEVYSQSLQLLLLLETQGFGVCATHVDEAGMSLALR